MEQLKINLNERILSLKGIYSNGIYKERKIISSYISGNYKTVMKIESVFNKRTGETFTVGDKIQIRYSGKFTILEILLGELGFYFKLGHPGFNNKYYGDSVRMINATSFDRSNIIFTTDDNKHIRQGDNYWCVNLTNYKITKQIASEKFNPTIEYLDFSSYSAAVKFRNEMKSLNQSNEDKLLFSYNDLMKMSKPYANKSWLGKTKQTANTYKFKKTELKKLMTEKLKKQ